MAKVSHSNPALDDCIGFSSQCETQRAMRQAMRLMSLSPEELEERREQFLRENYEETEESDYDHHCTYYGRP